MIDIDPERDWVLSSHRLSGKPAFIGISTLEILHQYVKINDFQGHPEIPNLSFVTPLIYNQEISRKVRLAVKPSGDLLSFRISSTEEKSNTSKEIWMDHVKGEFRISQEMQTVSIDIQELSKKIEGEVDTLPHFLELLNDEGKPVLKYDNRWDCKLSNRNNRKEFLIELRLRDEFLDDLDHFSFHPAMLDVATSSAIPYIEKALFLPFSYRDIALYRPLPAHFWCYAKLSDEWKADNEDMKFEVSLIDGENRLLGTIGQVTFRRLAQNLGKASQGQTRETAEKPLQDLAAFAKKNDILPEEGVEVFKKLFAFRQFPQVVINTTDLNQDISEEKPSYKKQEKQGKEEEKSEGSSVYERPQLSTPFEAPENEIEIAVAAIWKGILGIDKIGVNDSFMELGGNSLLAIQTISNIADEFDLELQPNVFFENPTVKGLSERIVELIISLKGADEIEAMLKEIENEE